MNKRRLRALWLGAHRWIGLTAGLLFVLLGLSGSLLVFYPELELLVHPERSARSEAPPASASAIVAALQAAEAQRQGSWRIELPRWPEAPIKARYYQPEERAGRLFAPLLLTLDPSSLAITDRHFWGDDFFTWIYDLHYTLLLENTGKTLLGYTTLLLLFLLASGIYLWWPAGDNWAGALAFKRSAAWKRRIYDLHVKVGVYALLQTGTLSLTGLVLLLPHWFTPAIDALSPRTPYFQAPAQGTALQIDADAAVDIARKQFPDAEVRWIQTPSADKFAWRIQLYQPGEPNRRFPRSNVWIDPASGLILATRDPRRNSAGDSLMDWLHPLHSGEALGLPGRLLVLLGGLLPALAWLTGLVRWRQKQRNRRLEQ